MTVRRKEIRLVLTCGAAVVTSSAGQASAQALDAVAAGQVASSGDLASQGSGPPGEPLSSANGDIVVTAQKVEQRLRDVPAPVSVLPAQALIDANRLSIRDFFTSVPGLSFQAGPQQTQQLSIRGISNQIAGLPTVSVLLDDAPLVSQVEGSLIPDIDPDQISRIEILKGPQGTLYGASTMGGLLKYVTKDPSTSGFSGSVQAGVSGLSHGGRAGYNVRGNVNVPLTDTFAVRVGGFDRRDPGYIDNLLTGERDINALDVAGGNITALWRPLSGWSLKINAIYQHSSSQSATNDVDSVNLAYGVTQRRARNSQLSRNTTGAVSGVLRGEIGDVKVTNILAYNESKRQFGIDYSSALSALTLPLYNVSGAIVPARAHADVFSEELRLNGTLFNFADWTLGGYYTNQHGRSSDRVVAEDPVTGVIVPGSEALLVEQTNSSYREYAVFADVTAHFTDKLSLELGGREVGIRVANSDSHVGLLGNIVNPRTEINQSAFTFSIVPTYRISPEHLVYLRAASGFRVGGFNSTSVGGALAGVAFPSTYNPDKTIDYEVGYKGSWFDGRIDLDLNAYYIDWKNIQLNVSVVNGSGARFGYTTNAGRAKSAGIEAQLTTRPWQGATLGGWFNYNDGVLKSSFPGSSTTVGRAGDRLPFNSRYTGSVSFRQDFTMAGGWKTFGSVEADYVGPREGRFRNSAVRQHYASYTTAQAAIGVSKDTWSGNFFVNNLTNSHGVNIGGLDFAPPNNAAIFIRPRSYGFNLKKDF